MLRRDERPETSEEGREAVGSDLKQNDRNKTNKDVGHLHPGQAGSSKSYFI